MEKITAAACVAALNVHEAAKVPAVTPDCKYGIMVTAPEPEPAETLLNCVHAAGEAVTDVVVSPMPSTANPMPDVDGDADVPSDVLVLIPDVEAIPRQSTAVIAGAPDNSIKVYARDVANPDKEHDTQVIALALQHTHAVTLAPVVWESLVPA